MRWDAESQEKIIVADVGGDGGKTLAERGEIKASGALVDLNGVAAAHGDMGLGLPFKMAEFAERANAAGGVVLDPNGLKVAYPDIKGDESRIFFSVRSDEKLRGFGGFN